MGRKRWRNDKKMNRKPLPSEIEEQKDEWIVDFPMEIAQPNMFVPKLVPDNTICTRCGLTKGHNCFTLFRTGKSCRCKNG